MQRIEAILFIGAAARLMECAAAAAYQKSLMFGFDVKRYDSIEAAPE